MSVWRERKKKKITSLSRITPFNNECILCAFAIPPPLLPLPPLSPSVASLLRLHLCRHPLPPCSKERPRMTTGTGGGGRLVHGHCHLPSSPLSLPFPLRGSLWGCLAMASKIATMNARVLVHHNNRVAAVARGLCRRTMPSIELPSLTSSRGRQTMTTLVTRPPSSRSLTEGHPPPR